ncbi:MAG: heme-binding beta-barrel domain-containing protein [Candidatus Saccharicenans sp.]|nr:heme-binding beta-barrel domain-containing protein [Candidatus Saccharicenans sp.]
MIVRKTVTWFVLWAALTSGLVLHLSAQPEDVWRPFKYFLGRWEGRGEGQSGISTGKQEFQFIMNGQYLQVRNVAQFEPQEKNPRGQRHEDWGFFSFDRTRKKFVLRQFHLEGFVNQYVCESISDDGRTFIFVSEQIENIPPGWKARLTYRILNENEFQQTFDLAAPGKELECYSSGVMKRVK